MPATIDGRLRCVMESRKNNQNFSDLPILVYASGEPEEITKQLESAGARVSSRIGHIWAAQVPLLKIEDVSKLPQVNSIELG